MKKFSIDELKNAYETLYESDCIYLWSAIDAELKRRMNKTQYDMFVKKVAA